MTGWRPIKGWEGKYEINDRGQVRSVDRRDSRGHRQRGKLLKLTPHTGRARGGVVTLSDQPRRRQVFYPAAYLRKHIDTGAA